MNAIINITKNIVHKTIKELPLRAVGVFLFSILGMGMVNAQEMGTSNSTYYTYTIGSSGLGTLCFPLDVNLWKQDNDGTWELKGFRAFTVTGVSEKVLTLTEIPQRDNDGNTNSIPEKTPVIIYGTSGTTFSCGSYTSSSTPSTCTAGLLVGNLSSTALKIHGEKLYVMQNNPTTGVGFYCCNGMNGDTEVQYSVKQFRCYLDLSKVSAAKATTLSFTIPDENLSDVDAIEKVNATHNTIKANSKLTDGIYNLSGMRVDNPQHGNIYLMVLDGQAVKVRM